VRALAPLFASLAAAALLVACGASNPVLGEWELDRDETRYGAVLAAELAQLDQLSFGSESVVAGDVEISGSYVVEEERVRFVRSDGRGEHAIEILSDERIRVELPIGISAVYRRADR
jgi:hypothetical protein